MVLVWTKCSLTTAGLIQGESAPGSPYETVLTNIEIGGEVYEVATLQVELSNGSAAWTSATLELKWANRDVGVGPWYQFATPATIATADHVASNVPVEGQYLAVICTAGESGVLVDIYLHLRKTN
jgi:hypothetical protein